LGLVAVLAGGVCGCGVERSPTATPTAAPAPTIAAGGSAVPSVVSSVVVDDPPGTIACAQLAVALRDGSLMTAGVVDSIVSASATADAPVADAADRLSKAYDAARAAAGKADEPDVVAAVGARASEMSDVCTDSGLQTVG
jgi:hypothetical protein